MDEKKEFTSYMCHDFWVRQITFFYAGWFQLEATPTKSYSLYILWNKLNKEEIWNILQTFKYQW